MKGDIQFDKLLQRPSMLQVVIDFLQLSVQFGVLSHPFCNVGQDPRLDNDATVDQLSSRNILQDRVKSKEFGDTVHVNLSHNQPAPNVQPA